MEISFVKVNDNQIDQLVAIGKTSFSDAYSEQTKVEDMEIYLNNAFQISKIKQEISNAQSVFYFVRKNTETVGYIKLRWDRTPQPIKNEKSLEIERFYLLKDYYKQGIGAEMLRFCENYARDHYFQSIWLLVWQENQRALQFYQQKGFDKFGIKLFEFAGIYEENWLMKKLLITT